MRFDSTEAFPVFVDVLLDLGLAHSQHPPELLDGRVLLENLPYPLQSEAQVAKRQDPMEPAELVRAVEAIAVGRIDSIRFEHADLVVVTQHPGRHLTESGELSDVQHDGISDTPSHCVKVKCLTVANPPLIDLTSGTTCRPRCLAAGGPGANSEPPMSSAQPAVSRVNTPACVEVMGLEPTTSALRTLRSTGLSYTPVREASG